jgi:hypothetical protein
MELYNQSRRLCLLVRYIDDYTHNEGEEMIFHGRANSLRLDRLLRGV